MLAWGNSIGDLIADTAMAKRGHPRTGFSACFGGPLFNLLLGILQKIYGSILGNNIYFEQADTLQYLYHLPKMLSKSLSVSHLRLKMYYYDSMCIKCSEFNIFYNE